MLVSGHTHVEQNAPPPVETNALCWVFKTLLEVFNTCFCLCRGQSLMFIFVDSLYLLENDLEAHAYQDDIFACSSVDTGNLESLSIFLHSVTNTLTASLSTFPALFSL